MQELELQQQIGTGGFGVVHVGRWHHAQVAVKKFLNQSRVSEQGVRQLREEVALHETLRFPFIVQVSCQPKGISICTPSQSNC